MKLFNKSQEIHMNIYCCMYENCPSEYSTKFNLRRHVESVHMHVKKYQCSVCHLYYASKQGLQEHLHMHTGQMPFKCSACNLFFRQGSQLSLHKRMHKLEGENPIYEKIRVEKYSNITPIEVCMEVDKVKFKLPRIEKERARNCLLPFPALIKENN